MKTKPPITLTAPPDQLSLIDGESDDALLTLTEGQLTRRYTAAQVRKLAERLDPIKAMLGKGVFTVDEIASACHVNTRTVQKIAELYAREVGKQMGETGDLFLGNAVHVFNRAMELVREGKGSLKDLSVLGGILATNGVALKQASAGSAPERDITEVSQVSEKAEAIRAMLAKKINHQDTKTPRSGE